MKRAQDNRPTRIVIAGGGFAGVTTAHALRKAARAGDIEVAVISRENAFVFYPLMPEVISGALRVETILTSIRHVVPHARLYAGELTGIDLERRTVTIQHGLYQHQQHPLELPYDHLVLALGGVPATFGIPGLDDYTFDVQRLSNAFALRNHLIDLLEQADIESDPDEQRRLLTVVVIGGGPTGVEVAAEIRSLFTHALPFYRNIRPGTERIVLVEALPRLLTGFPEEAAERAARELRQRGIEVSLERKVVRVDPAAVMFDDGTSIESRTVVSAIGVEPNPIVRSFGLPLDSRGRLLVDEFLRVAGFPDVWAIGDNAAVTDPATGRPYAPTAQHAVRQAKLLARNLVASLSGRPLEPMRYRTRGMMVTLGDHAAIAWLGRVTVTGFPAWWLWRTYALLQIPRWDRRIRLAMEWTLDLLFPPELVQLKVGQPAPATRRLVEAALRRLREAPGPVESPASPVVSSGARRQ
ncbi:NAD(P)/FAD-dependent oxidoreductase [Thermomicrobium sp. 4228-Ro]|uniref:NAD(P)/FAD-dependent oxidoreductase n=1 Tax=Thermomicrobium sp. 4228-Ro TaxID=2993937 RepID=UPI00224879A5|nr:NAD(P)/FAD-dependent oxidoreductase [Thermomicrobium sp. 4228-Ro]MCX2726995.1 NAD(P)/FAD-dependent oxidoreductase [Thermomicrobium sp. 4228-Ro]